MGTIIDLSSSTREWTCNFKVEDETATQSMVLPPNFEQQLFQQYQECQQGGRTIQVYVDDFYHLYAHNDFIETEA